ncbi:MAG: alanine racemase, partial [Bdellovibrionales bacterium]|nr:alanine racemase [Bdellovibrionales bacterium]
MQRLRSNFRLLRAGLGPQEFLCPMVKADAYGHGDVQVALALEAEGAGAMGVATVEEGIGLRSAGVRAPILVFGLFDDRSAEETVRAD